MTCIVAIKVPTSAPRVLMAGDSAGVGGLSLQHRFDPKVFVNDGIAFGFTGSFRMGDILRYSFTVPKRTVGDNLDKWLRTDFIDDVRQALKDGGYTRIRDGREEGGGFLIGVEGRLFSIDDDFQVGEVLEDYMAVGCGEDLAMGSLHTTATLGKFDAKARAWYALEAASHHSAGVCAPYRFTWSLSDPETGVVGEINRLGD